MDLWRTFEFRGHDLHDNPFVDFGFAEKIGGRLALSSHLLRQPLWVDSEHLVLPCFKHYYEAQGVSQLRSKVLWKSGRPVDSAFEEGWQAM
jgi:hypothetical protein